MRVRITQGGGIAGLVRVVSADTGQLEGKDREALQELVEEARTLRRSDAPTGVEPHPDEGSLAVEVETDGQTERWIFPAGAAPDPLRRLTTLVGKLPGHTETVEPPGAFSEGSGAGS